MSAKRGGSGGIAVVEGSIGRRGVKYTERAGELSTGGIVSVYVVRGRIRVCIA